MEKKAAKEDLKMKLWIYWMGNDYSRHYEERILLPGDSYAYQVDYEDACFDLICRMNRGEIKDYQVELRK